MFLAERVYKGEITQKKADQYMAEEAAKLVAHIKIKDVPKGLAWQYADVFRTAKDWNHAKEAYEIAVKTAKNEDRRINDTLRLAQCTAATGDVKGAISLAKTVMNAKPVDSAPILPAVYLEIVPAARGQGCDLALAELILQAIKKHKETVVDKTSSTGQQFLFARSYHISRAIQLAYDLYMEVGQKEKAQSCLKIAIPTYLPALPPGMSVKDYNRTVGEGGERLMYQQLSYGQPMDGSPRPMKPQPKSK